MSLITLVRHSRAVPPVPGAIIPADWDTNIRTSNETLLSYLSDQGTTGTLQQLIAMNLNSEQIHMLPDKLRRSYENEKKRVASERRIQGPLYREKYRMSAEHIVNFLLDDILRYLQTVAGVTLYGTGVYNRIVCREQAYNDVFTFSRPQQTFDIDVCSDSPDSLSINVYQHLLTYLCSQDFLCDGKIFTVERLELSKDIHKNSITIVLRCDGYHIARHTILDCVPSSTYNFTTIKLSSGIMVQSPLGYLVGMCDKLWNSRINPHIDNTHREDAEKKMLARFRDLRLSKSMELLPRLIEEAQRWYLSAAPLSLLFLRYLTISVEKALAWYEKQRHVFRIPCIGVSLPVPPNHRWRDDPPRYTDEEFPLVSAQLQAGELTVSDLFSRGLTASQLKSLPKELRKSFSLAFEEFNQKRAEAIEQARLAHEASSLLIIEHFRAAVWSWISLYYPGCIYHGSYAYNEMCRGVPEYEDILTFAEPLEVSDIDIYVRDARRVAEEIYHYLFDYCSTSEFHYAGSIYTVGRLELTHHTEDGSSRHSIAITVKYDGYHVYRQNIFDSVEIDRRRFSLCNSVRNLQSPAAFLCGTVGKLYAAKGSRGNDTTLEKAIEDKLVLRLGEMQLHKLSDETKRQIYDESRKVKTICEKPAAQTFLNILSEQGVAAALEYFRQGE